MTDRDSRAPTPHATAATPSTPGHGQLKAIRSEIDTIDDALVDLLEHRCKLAQSSAAVQRALQQPLYDPEREAQTLERLQARASARCHTFPASAIGGVFREVMSACLAIEGEVSAAYLGPPGSFTHMAARAAFGVAARYVEAATISGVFDAVERNRASHGVVPFENSTEGGVTFTLDGLIDSQLLIRSEIILDISQCLVGTHDDLARIERVYSHPQALAQCRQWLAKNLPNAQLVVSHSTTAAARQAAEDPTSAAVASRLAAQFAQLQILRESIQDHPLNATRFVILAKEDAPPTGSDKTSLVFSTRDERGALRRVLDVFDEEGINLSRIESRPAKSKLWEYVFFTEIVGHRTDPPVARALARVEDACQMARVFGSYPQATTRHKGCGAQ